MAVIMVILGSIGAILFVTTILEEILFLDGCLFGVPCFLFFVGYSFGGNLFFGLNYGARGVIIYNLVGIVLGIIALIIKGCSSSSSSYSSNYEFDKDGKPSYDTWLKMKEFKDGTSPDQPLYDSFKKSEDSYK
jgi:hypothetical protein